jgi:5-methylcytosine-specific restriction endonuclease McrA
MSVVMRWAFNETLGLHRVRGKRAQPYCRPQGRCTDEDKARIRSIQKDQCAYCRVKLNGAGEFDHIIPKARGGSNWPRNMQWLCCGCNNEKSALDPVDFARRRGLLI